MRKRLSQQRIPTIAALVLLFVGVWVTNMLVKNQVLFTGRAADAKIPQHVTIANVTNSSFTVAYTTTDPVVSAITVEEAGKTSYTIFDDRDKAKGDHTAFKSHFVTVSNLTPLSSYKIKILQEGKTYPEDGTAYNATTGPLLGPATTNKALSGKVITPEGTNASDTLVVVTFDEQSFAALSDNNGNYKLDLSGLRTKDLKKYADLNEDTKIDIAFLSGDFLTNASVLYSNIDNLPTVTLSYGYDFSDSSTQEVSTGSSLLKSTPPRTTSLQARITSPLQNATLIDTKPLFSGIAQPNSNVRLSVSPANISTIVTSDTSGRWSFRSSSPLSGGRYTLSITALDQFGISKSLTTNFSIFSSGSQVTESATPSATPRVTATLTPSRTPSATPTVTRAPTAIPTIGATSTPTTTPIVGTTLTPTTTVSITSKPTATATLMPKTTPGQPGSGLGIMLTLASVLLIGGGLALMFLI